MPDLKGSKTHENLKAAFAGESQANRRYLYFAKQADVEGRPDIAGLFRDTAEGETGHAHGHLEFLEQVGDPATGEPIGDTEKNLAAAVAGETYEYTQMYPGFARHAREASGKHLEEGGAMIEEHEAAQLLEKVEVRTENPVSLLQEGDYRKVVELCYECKLCYPKCPYVPPHEFAVDFPKLMLRAKIQGAQADGIALRERFLGATDLVGTAMTRIAPFANAAAHNSFNRMLMEQTIGI